ncbi:piezo-type mechanosensitive ion channel component [Drosophila teissieri]|uniref:piezo-type mechanosensitive ion channel component n=1 Tax=Drosophila teissieri TaxID=7243 RepID=UPI001CB9EE39|nr:piezo-type mechanosensitive ion channel component [Drosophila teissieri]
MVLYFAATLRPSLPGSLYFCMFIIAGTYWALYRQRKMYYSVIFMVVALLVHITCIFAYQLPILQSSINCDKFWTRLMGMEILFRLFKDNKNGKIMELNAQLNLDSYLSPIALMLAYFATTLSLINRSQYEITFNTIRMNLGPKTNNIYSNKQPPNEENQEISIDMKPSMLEQFFYILCELTSFVYQNSYILLNIIMMSCGLNLEQIGFVHPQNKDSQPWIPLTVKTGFLLVFWVTSRQYFREKSLAQQKSDLLQQIFGTHPSRSKYLPYEKSKTPQICIYILKSASNFITRIWMWLLIFLIFLCAMIDRTMTGFRICYMSLFLLFLMIFQMSLQLWIRFLYGFWMFLIFYAMTILTAIYTYQFDNFDYYWEKFLKVQPTLQCDIGLRRYQTKELFLHLLIPTLTVIFTVVQLHYFHRRFVESVRRPRSTESQNSHLAFNAETLASQKTLDIHRQSWKVFFNAGYENVRAKGRQLFSPGKLVVWKFLEMHMIKTVTVASFYSAISEVCFLNVFLMILSLLGICGNRFLRRIIFRTVTFWISLLVLMKMIYQIKYMDQSNYNFNCRNVTFNFADWMGLRKTGTVFGVHLRYISPYIIYMILTSLHAVVKLRNHLIRYSINEQKDRKLLFPDITRQDAERDFPGLLKYVLNYGFFKFGFEITLIGLVSTIAHRRDLLALTYLIWLVLLLSLSRFRCARIWEILQIYFVLSIFVQYVYLLTFPPNLCKVYSYKSLWDTSDSKNYKNRSNIMFDYIVLLLISRQRKSFRVEMRHINDLSYRGGVNTNVVSNIAKLGHVYFENPTHDFCSYVRNYADVFKTAIFFSFFWITLAIVFLGGVCSTDILSLGYIIFALIFLLQGSEIYLQNIHFIICRWNCLIAFNILNIMVKVAIIVLEGTIVIEKKSILSIVFNVMHQTAPCENVNDNKISEINEITKKNLKYCYGPSNLIFRNTLVWHVIIFSFVIFQHRIFRSYYFCHVIMDTQANTILASRGATIIENLHYKQIYDRRKNEKNVLDSVKMKMEQIRTTNRRHHKQMTGLDFHPLHQPPRNSIHVHGREKENTVLKTLDNEFLPTIKQAERDTYFSRSLKPRHRNLSLHPHAVRTGDYYMFNEFDDEDDLDVYEEYDFLEIEDLRARQIRQSFRSRASNYNKSKSFLCHENSDYNNKLLETHPVITLTSELIILLTFKLNRLSKNFRFVHKMLSAEKKKLQEINIMKRLGLSNTAAMFKFLNKSLNNQLSREAISDLVSQGDDFTTFDHNDFVQMLIALWYALIANTEAICYLVVFLNQAANSSMISLPMPFLVLCWGALTLPRPTKTFWVTLITYNLTMIFLKSIMHQRVLLDQQLFNRSNSLSFELIMKRGRAVYDLFLLVVLFWHQYMLKKQGIWTIQRTNSELLLLEKHPSHYNRSFSKERPENIRKLLREEGGDEPKKGMRSDTIDFERDMDDLLLPVLENKYVYQNIESEYYRKTMQGLAHKGGLLSGFHKFFLALRHKSRLSTDVYTLLFLCDFISFFILLFGFPKFVYRYKYSTSVLETYIQGNKVPFTFLLMLIVQFIAIVTERAIYLRKALIYKIVFHFISVVGIHFWMFFLVPYITAHSFGETAPVLFYLIKCLHMLLSAYQIRCGYPKRILGNVFTKGYSLVNYIAFKIYMEIPFLYILRTMLDWVCIDTTLTVMEWIKMEDIFQSVFIVRCYRQMDTDFPVLRGEPKALYSKLLIGGTIILILIALIWSPLFLFALVGTVGKPNIPRKADIALKINHYEPIYVSQSKSDILQFSNTDFQKLTNRIILNNYASDSMMLYDAVDVTAIKFYENSISLWNMPPPDKDRLLHDLKNGATLEIHLTLTLKCNLTPEAVIYETNYTLTENKIHTRDKLIRLMSADFSNEKVIVPNILPKFLTVQRQQANAKFIKDYDGKFNRPIILKKKEANQVNWWEMNDYCDDRFYTDILSALPLSNCENGVVLYVFNDKSFPSAMSFLEKTGIIGLYTTFVYLVSRIIRSIISNKHRRIMFEDLPYVDRVLKLCTDIYLVRETQEYRLEEDLYGKLIFLYRSPETLIKWTRFKEDISDAGSSSQLSIQRT